MTTVPAPEPGVKEIVQSTAKLRRRRDLVNLDYRRQLRRLALLAQSDKYPQRVIALELGISQPALSKALSQTEEVSELPEGFHGASPYEICERYEAGEINRDRLIDELIRWPYAKRGKTDGFDGLTVDPPGTWGDVTKALRDGLIDAEAYDRVLDAFNER